MRRNVGVTETCLSELREANSTPVFDERSGGWLGQALTQARVRGETVAVVGGGAEAHPNEDCYVGPESVHPFVQRDGTEVWGDEEQGVDADAGKKARQGAGPGGDRKSVV